MSDNTSKHNKFNGLKCQGTVEDLILNYDASLLKKQRLWREDILVHFCLDCISA